MTDRDGQADYSPTGQRHVHLFEEYEDLMTRSAKLLREDCPHFRPVEGAFSPYGAIYGTPTNLLEDMALKTLQRDAVTRFSLEDVFADEATGTDDKLTWINGLRKLPHIDREVQKQYEYPEQFAKEIFDRIEHAFQRSDRSPTGRLFIVPGDDRLRQSRASAIPDLPVRYIGSSDTRIVAARQADAYDETQLLDHRQEGYFAVSYETSGGWVAIKKDFLTEILGTGGDIRIAGLPAAAAAVLGLTCRSIMSPQSDIR